MKEKLKKWLLDNIYFIFFSVLFITINILFFKRIPNSNNYLVILLFMLLMEFVFLIILNNKCKKKYPIEKIFLIMAIPLGLLYMIILPFGEVPDEQAHYARSYSITKGYIVSSVDKNGYGYANLREDLYTGIYSSEDSNSYKKVVDNITVKKENPKEIYFGFTNTSLYSFVVYIPQCIGISIGNLLNLSPLMSAYLGRLFNFITYIILIYFSLKLIPFFKKSVLLISLLPISLQEGMSLSSDSLTISMSLLLISYILYLKYSYKGRITIKHFMLLLISSIVCSMSKIVYIPFILLLFLLPSDLFKSKKDKYIKVLLIVIISIMLNGVWTIYATRYLAETNPGVNSSKQLEYILNSPLSFVKVCISTFMNYCLEMLFQTFGMRMGLLNIHISRFYPELSFFVLLLLSIVNCCSTNKIKVIDKIVSIFTTIVIVGLILTSLYIQWTPYKENIVVGLQGRYFIPLLIFVPIIFMKTNKSKIVFELKENNKFDRYLYSFIVFQIINTACHIVLFNI